VAELVLDGVSKVYPGGVTAVSDLDLRVDDGELVVIVGPSGCGKTTTLRLIAGLETPTRGTIRLGDRVLDRLPPGDRGLAMVFQDHGLYPHMSVHENLVFNPRLRKIARPERERRAREAAEVMGVAHLVDRMPRTLSGGERQRVAVGRAITAQPQCILFDEPLSNLDAPLREQMREAIRTLHRRLGGVTVYVTHDQQEAITLADRVAVMCAGALQQVGCPRELLARPANRFVAGFIGSPAMSFVEGTVRHTADGPCFSDGHGLTLELPMAAGEGSVVLGVRPGVVELAADALHLFEPGAFGRALRP
jgi:multiple sugar transport system ATP-binding protein